MDAHSLKKEKSRYCDIFLVQVSDEENAHLTAPYSKDEVKKGRFFKWNTIKRLVRMVSQQSSILLSELLGHHQVGPT
jgi:hypothetical protein